MKKAVIETGGKQFVVTKDQELNVELIGDKKQLTFKPLMVFDDKKVSVGTPEVEGGKVTAKVIDPELKGDKVTVFKFQAKKRVSTKTGHRQRFSRIKITNITS